MFSKTVLAAAFGLLFVSASFAQKENYAEIFSENYQRAVSFLKKEKSIDSVIGLHGLNPRELKGIVFPELVRYSAIQDKIETFALETLYVQYGKNYANFSIGEFQIKPEFAERLEIDFLKLFGEKELASNLKIKSADTLQSPQHRSSRLNRIKDKIGMTNYLCTFWKVLNAKYHKQQGLEGKIKFFAAAYNCGYWKTKKEIESFLSKKFFYTGLSLTATRYCYADIAWYYFQQPDK